MALADLLSTVATEQPFITPKHLAWLSTGGRYTPEAIAWAQEQMDSFAGPHHMPGPRAFRASEAGACPRRRLLTRYGPKPPSPTTSLQNTFQTGTFMHLKWQMAGLSAGWLTAAETYFYGPDSSNPLVRGKVDGELSWPGVFEYKSAGDWDWTKIQRRGAPLFEHEMQAGEALLILDKPVMHIIYEHKADGEWKEFAIPRTADLEARIADDRRVLETALEQRAVPPIKPRCAEKEGQEYSRCPHKASCPLAEMLIDWNKEAKS